MPNKNFNSIQLESNEVLLPGCLLKVNGNYPYLKKFIKESDKTLKNDPTKHKTYVNASFILNIKLSEDQEPVKCFLNTLEGLYRVIPSMYSPTNYNGKEISYDNIALKKDVVYRLIETGKDPNRKSFNLTGAEVAVAVKEATRSVSKTRSMDQDPQQDPQP